MRGWRRFWDANAAMRVGEAWTAYLAHHATLWGPHHIKAHREVSYPGGVTKKIGKGADNSWPHDANSSAPAG
jgi:hypothetical protein